MIYLSLYDYNKVKIDTDNEEVLRSIRDYFTYFEKNYYWTYSYQAGRWDGKVSLFNSARRSLPAGMLLELYKFLKKQGLINEVVIDDDLKGYFQSDINLKDLKINYDLKYYPYDYQKDIIEDALTKSRSIYRAGTGAGKSLIISYIIKILLDNNITKKHMIIVPTLSLIDQFKSDMVEYGIDASLIGKANKDYKQFDYPIVVSTWQTLKNNKDKLESFDFAVSDECHGNKAKEVNKIMESSGHMKYLLGVTGTLPDNQLERNRIISYIGPVWKEYSVDWLAKNGYLSECNIKHIKIKYKKGFQGDYNDIKYNVIRDPYRLSILKSIVKQNDYILVLVEKVKDEGEFIEDYLKSNIKDKNVVFLSGRDKSKVRELWRKNMEESENIVIVATYGIFSMGVNIKALKNIVILSSSKSKIRILQSIGRSLRLHDNKKDGGATIWDFHDLTKNLKKHGNSRERFYIKEGFEIETIEMNEKNDKNINKLFT